MIDHVYIRIGTQKEVELLLQNVLSSLLNCKDYICIVQKVGSYIDDDKDIQRRKKLATVALYKVNNVWINGSKLKTSTKIELYKALVKSILLCNWGTLALTLTEEERLNTYHRK